ncbi:MAG: hypothetical protein V7L14_17845 [Nostoc sp.]
MCEFCIDERYDIAYLLRSLICCDDQPTGWLIAEGGDYVGSTSRNQEAFTSIILTRPDCELPGQYIELFGIARVTMGRSLCARWKVAFDQIVLTSGSGLIRNELRRDPKNQRYCIMKLLLLINCLRNKQ